MSNYTRIDAIDSHYKQIAWGTSTLPPCQHALIKGGPDCDKPGEFDSPVQGYGSWADLCYEHVAIDGQRSVTQGYHRITRKG